MKVSRLGIVFLAASMLFAAWYFTRPNPLRAAASRMTQAMQVGDIKTLIDSMSAEERDCSDLNEEKVRRLWQLLIKPRVSTSTFLRMGPAEQEANDHQATATAYFVDASGDAWVITMIANHTSENPKTTLLFQMLTIATKFDADGRKILNNSTEKQLDQIRRLRPEIEALGVRRVMLSPGSCLSWDELEERYERSTQAPSTH